MMRTWKLHHPDWEYRLWTERNMIDLANSLLWDRAEEISPHAPEQFRSDVARYEILFHYGGVWVDADFVCHKPLDPLMGDRPFAGKVGRVLNNALVGSPIGHPVLFDLIANLPANVDRFGPDAGNTVKSGPQFFTPIARRHRVIEYPEGYFYPYDWMHLDSPSEGSYATHHWWNQRRLKEKPLQWTS